MINNNLDFEKNSNVAPTATAAAASVTTTTNNITHQHNGNSSYFNRFDNRIAANLAAVINGARFRSSSTSSPTTSPYKYSTKAAKCLGANSNSSSNLNVSHGLQKRYNGAATLATTNNTPTGARRYQQQQQQHYTPLPSSLHLQLNNESRSRPSSPLLSTGSMGRRRPLHLFTQANLNCNDNEKVAQTPSSDEDNSPTELNNCKRLADKPPLVKRLAMGLLRSNEESRPLVNNGTVATNPNTATTNSPMHKLHGSTSNNIYSNGYVNEEAFEPEKYIASKFGDSCRQSLTAIPMLDTLNLNDNSEFNLKKRYLRETSSANSSPKIFASRLRANTTASRYNNSSSTTAAINAAHASADDEESDLKDASWFQAGISRDIAVEVLSSKSPGAFLVRRSSSKPGCFALTLRVPSPPGPKIANYIILRTAKGYKIKGFRKEFTTLKALITHHSVMPELLPVPLAMPRPTNMTSSRRNLDDFDTYDSLQMLLKYLRAKNMENE